MKILRYLLLQLPLLSFTQELDIHQWKDRLVLVISDSYQNAKAVQQIRELRNNKKDLVERKLIVYQITPTSYRKGIKDHLVIKNSRIYKRYNASSKNFKIILIGLDGGIKMESTDIISDKKIFYKIDQMPMRKQELRIKN